MNIGEVIFDEAGGSNVTNSNYWRKGIMTLLDNIAHFALFIATQDWIFQGLFNFIKKLN